MFVAATSDAVAFASAFLGLAAAFFGFASIFRPGEGHERLDRAETLAAVGVLLAGVAAAVAYIDTAFEFTKDLPSVLPWAPVAGLGALAGCLFLVLLRR